MAYLKQLQSCNGLSPITREVVVCLKNVEVAMAQIQLTIVLRVSLDWGKKYCRFKNTVTRVEKCVL